MYYVIYSVTVHYTTFTVQCIVYTTYAVQCTVYNLDFFVNPGRRFLFSSQQRRIVYLMCTCFANYVTIFWHLSRLIHMRACVHVHAYMYIHVYVYVRIRVTHMCVYAFVCMCLCVWVYLRMNISSYSNLIWILYHWVPWSLFWDFFLLRLILVRSLWVWIVLTLKINPC